MITNVLEYLTASRARFPDRPAFADGQSCVTYRELTDLVCAMGTHLEARLGRKDRPVFVCIDRRLETVAAFLAVAASGNFYVPVDLKLPEVRLRSLFTTMEPAAVLTLGDDPRAAVFDPCPCIRFEDAAACRPREGLLEDAVETGLDTDPLYCIFTSGSTGVPKGVLVSHRSVIDMAEQFCRTFGLDETAVFGNQAPFDFDVSVKDIYIALRCGAQMQILETQLFMTPKRLIQRMNERGVNTLIWAASAMKILSALKTFETIRPAHLRLVMFSGEVLPCRILNNWMDATPGASYVNLYGPTEITCNCTYYRITRRFADDEQVPIGVPFRNCEIVLLDGDAPVTDGIGEICVRGTCLALGYYANPDATQRAFCRDPRRPGYPAYLYRTGDLGRLDGDGMLVYVGRRDSQVKYMGHRIELGEIEIAAQGLPQVRVACCLFDERREKLFLFYEADAADDAAVIAGLKRVLPVHMVPGKVVFVREFPHNRTGKIDRIELRRQYME